MLPLCAFALVLVADTPVSDAEAPIIEDVAAAASNPQAPPVVTVLMSDRGSGVGDAAVVFRSPGGAWQRAPLKGGTSGLFIAHLPDGLQKSGFEYYVEASDLSGNGARIASAETPIIVDRANEPTLSRLERHKKDAEPEAAVTPAIHPAWMMLSLGVGVLAGAGGGAYALDMVSINNRIDAVDEDLAVSGLTDVQRTRLESTKQGLNEAFFQDTIIASVLGVVAVAGLATGIVLVAVTSAE